ncbi:MAG: class I SAM-dependent methyltransferase [Deltaproteobacteria bacterium]|nr:class I SAM-dependent methyltransferase [Deltaproteobacteria bacterium]MBI4223341.1 class I SAM-dependent methyltransferase [Deltaproteobacteria bacterium]
MNIENCLFCGKSQKKILRADLTDVEAGTGGRFSVAQCLDCHFIYLSPRPAEENLPDRYPAHYYTQLKGRRSGLSQQLYRPRYLFRRRRIQNACQGIPSSLLEVGYGDGAFLAYLKEKWGERCQLAGIDFKPPPGQATLSGVDWMEGDFLRFPFKKSYDVITLYSVLEHLPRPLEALSLLSRLLKPKGLLVMEVPNWNSLWRFVFPRHWSGLQIPRHQIFPTHRSLGRLLERAGLRMNRYNRIFDPGDFSVSFCNWLSHRLKLKTPPRQAWFFLPATALFSPLVFLQWAVLRNSGEMECICCLKN